MPARSHGSAIVIITDPCRRGCLPRWHQDAIASVMMCNEERQCSYFEKLLDGAKPRLLWGSTAEAHEAMRQHCLECSSCRSKAIREGELAAFEAAYICRCGGRLTEREGCCSDRNFLQCKNCQHKTSFAEVGLP